MRIWSTVQGSLTECRKKGLRDILVTYSEAHASFLFKELLDEAKKTGEDVKIISGELRDSFYNGLVNSIPSEVKVELTVLKLRDFSGNKFIKAVAGNRNCKVLIPNSEVDHQKEIFHLIIVGTKKFRVETNHDDITALASFNSAILGSTLLAMSMNYFLSSDFHIPGGFCSY